ncbi:MAG: hypothetical protein PVJ22_13395, partial [Desulfobacterales bacterium]
GSQGLATRWSCRPAHAGASRVGKWVQLKVQKFRGFPPEANPVSVANVRFSCLEAVSMSGNETKEHRVNVFCLFQEQKYRTTKCRTLK